MNIIGIVFCVGLLLVTGVVIAGYALPVHHVASRTFVLPAAPERVWRTLNASEEFPLWRSEVKAVEVHDPIVREITKYGAIDYRTIEREENRRLVREIATAGLPYGGSWTFELAKADAGTTLTITERGAVYNPVFRVVSKLVGHTRTIEAFGAALARRVGG